MNNAQAAMIAAASWSTADDTEDVISQAYAFMAWLDKQCPETSTSIVKLGRLDRKDREHLEAVGEN